MPSRKSDQPRKSDAASTTARSVPAEDAPEDTSTVSVNQESTDAAAAPAAATTPSGKDSNKDKEHKEAVTIEVWTPTKDPHPSSI
jgi:hypothetical protein